MNGLPAEHRTRRLAGQTKNRLVRRTANSSSRCFTKKYQQNVRNEYDDLVRKMG